MSGPGSASRVGTSSRAPPISCWTSCRARRRTLARRVEPLAQSAGPVAWPGGGAGQGGAQQRSACKRCASAGALRERAVGKGITAAGPASPAFQPPLVAQPPTRTHQPGAGLGPGDLPREQLPPAGFGGGGVRARVCVCVCAFRARARRQRAVGQAPTSDVRAGRQPESLGASPAACACCWACWARRCAALRRRCPASHHNGKGVNIGGLGCVAALHHLRGQPALRSRGGAGDGRLSRLPAGRHGVKGTGDRNSAPSWCRVAGGLMHPPRAGQRGGPPSPQPHSQHLPRPPRGPAPPRAPPRCLLPAPLPAPHRVHGSHGAGAGAQAVFQQAAEVEV